MPPPDALAFGSVALHPNGLLQPLLTAQKRTKNKNFIFYFQWFK